MKNILTTSASGIRDMLDKGKLAHIVNAVVASLATLSLEKLQIIIAIACSVLVAVGTLYFQWRKARLEERKFEWEVKNGRD